MNHCLHCALKSVVEEFVDLNGTNYEQGRGIQLGDVLKSIAQVIAECIATSIPTSMDNYAILRIEVMDAFASHTAVNLAIVDNAHATADANPGKILFN